MAYRPTFAIDAIGRDEPAALAIGLEAMGYMLGALVSINRSHLRRFPNTVRLYSSGVRYDPMDPPEGSACGDDDWADIVTILGTKETHGRMVADCEDLACWRVAELNEAFGIAAKPHIFLRRDYVRVDGERRRRHLYHVVVEWPEGLRKYPRTVQRIDGRLIEDPSLVLGMGRQRDDAQYASAP